MKKTLLLLAAIAAWSTIQVSAFYNPSTGRWLSRDPAGEKAGANLYSFVSNVPVQSIDFLGRFTLIEINAVDAALIAALDLGPALGPLNGTPPTKTSPPPGTPQHPGGGQCPNNPPGANGCGPEGWKGKLVPNMPFWMINFKDPCDGHDRCYSTCGKLKDDCDQSFRGDLWTACYLKWGRDDFTADPPKFSLPTPDQFFLKRCIQLADIYYQAVAKGGNTPYTDAQKEGCKCLCKNRK
jgi:hypothetical protein